MGDGRFISWQFCDDVRQEVGNKVSLMGCYGPSMLVTTMPIVLPRLCVQIKAYTPVGRSFTKLSVRVVRDEQVLVETVFPEESLQQVNAVVCPPEARFYVLSAIMVVSPFPIEQPSRLTIEAETEDAILTSGSFWIDQIAQPRSSQ